MILKNKNPKRFTTMDNSFLEDQKLSWKAKGLLAYLLTKPKKWKVRVEGHLDQIGPDGTDSTRTALKELQEQGYAKFVRLKDSQGRAKGTSWKVRENRFLDFTGVDIPRLGKIKTRKTPMVSKYGVKIILNGVNTEEVKTPPPPLEKPTLTLGDISSTDYISQMIEEWIQWGQKKRIFTGKKSPNLKKWRNSIQQLLELHNKEWIDEILVWYFSHHKDKYVPYVLGIPQFCEKFPQIQKSFCYSENRTPPFEEQEDDHPRHKVVRAAPKKVSEKEFLKHMKDFD